MMKLRRSLAAAALLMLAAGNAFASTPAPESLIRVLDDRSAGERPSPGAVSWSRVTLGTELLAAAPEVLTLDLAGGQRHQALRVALERRGPADLFWRGHLAAGPEHAVLLTLKNGYVMGLIYSPEGVFELGSVRDGGQVLMKLDHNLFPECAVGREAGEASAWRPRPPVPLTASSDVAAARAGRDLPDQIQVMCLYTPQAAAGAGGTAAIEATCQSAIDVSNTTFINSDIVARYTLVHTEQATRNDSGDIFADRNWLGSDPGVAALRETHKADLVGMMTEDGGGGCGVAFLMGNEDPVAFGANAFQITARSCAVGNLTYPHEHGHNLGMQHNPQAGAPPSQAIYVWSYGHFHNGVYRTVMSYNTSCPNGCTRHPYMSNPSVSFMGLPTGIADQRDNHRTGNLIAPIAANWKTNPIFADSFEIGDTSAWTLTEP